jgi:acyl-CoA synthetase (AMP-forming)/AMP-acid ligase II
MEGYFRLPELTKERLKGGWVHTGDVGVMDADGILTIVDRKSDMIVSGAENVFPREVEDVLLQHPAIFEAAVVGTPDDLWGEVVRAGVTLKPDQAMTESELIDFCRGRLARYKAPRSITFLMQMPKNAMGKIERRAVRSHLVDALH